MSVLVIGYGNTLRGDDGAGIRAVERIGDAYPDVDIITQHELTVELAERVSTYDTVVFVDATVESATLQVGLLPHRVDETASGSHAHTPASIMALARMLFGTTPAQVYVIGIPAFSFDFSETLSAATAAAVEECMRRFPELIGV